MFKENNMAKWVIAVIVLVLTLFFCYDAFAQDMRDSVVEVSVIRKSGDEYGGVGFFVTDKLVLTCRHVINDRTNNNAYVILKGKVLRGKVVATYPYADLALIRIKNGKGVPLNKCEGLSVGDFVETHTYDYGIYDVKPGIVTGRFVSRIETNTIAIPGNSGSPLMKTSKLKSCVAGILFAKGKNGMMFYTGVFDIDNFLWMYQFKQQTKKKATK